MKRFYKDVAKRAVGDGWQVTLDGRGLKTVKGSPQVVPHPDLAEALASEWARQGETLDANSFVFRDMADYAIDVVTPDPGALSGKLIAYAETDTLCYRADPNEPLYERQQQVWEPVLAGFEARQEVAFVRVSGIVHRPQDEATLAKLRARLETERPFTLAALEAMTSLSASLVIALSASDAANRTDALALWQAASLEEEWQAELWGRDEEAEQRRQKREADFLKAWEFARLSRQ